MAIYTYGTRGILTELVQIQLYDLQFGDRTANWAIIVIKYVRALSRSDEISTFVCNRSYTTSQRYLVVSNPRQFPLLFRSSKSIRSLHISELFWYFTSVIKLQ